MRATSYDALSSSLDLNNRYSCASSQASTQDAFEENNFYRLDFTCPYCTNPSYITGEHFGDNRYIVTYDFEQAVEYTTECVSSMEDVQNTLLPLPPADDHCSGFNNIGNHENLTDKKGFNITSSAEKCSEDSEEQIRTNTKFTDAEKEPKRGLYDIYAGENNVYKNSYENKPTRRLSKRIRNTPLRYIEQA